MAKLSVNRLVVAAMCILASACAADGPSSPSSDAPRLAQLTVSPSTVALKVGQTIALMATALDQTGSPLQGQSFTWSSANAGIATVDGTGSASGVSSGSTTISVRAGALTATAAVTVSNVSVATVSVSPPSLQLAVGASQKAAASVKDSAGNVLARAVIWTTSEAGVATVGSDGTVTGIGPGSTTLTATCEGVTGSATVVVAAPELIVSLNYATDLGLSGTRSTLTLNVTGADASTGLATVNGADSRAPMTPFTFNWGDGSATTGFFPQSHTYTSTTKNYIVRVIAHYSSGSSDTAQAVAKFQAPAYTQMPFPAAAAVTIPQAMPLLTSRLPGAGFSSSLQAVPASLFTSTLPRSTLEYVLSQAAAIELGILENDVEKVDDGWRQVVLNDPSFAGAYSIWYSSPIALAVGSSFFGAAPGYSSLFHEMAHNLSLNAPAAFRFGGRIDGNANAIFSEAVAQMFQHTVAFELVNNASTYGIPADLALEIAGSAHSSAQIIQGIFETYLSQGKPFTTWNDPATSGDETLGSFIALARQFMIHAEQARSYVGPLTRVMRLLRTFNSTMASQYAPQENSATANTFRSTLMVAAVSYGFQQDLRAEFRGLNFPVDDVIYESLYGSVP